MSTAVNNDALTEKVAELNAKIDRLLDILMEGKGVVVKKEIADKKEVSVKKPVAKKELSSKKTPAKKAPVKKASAKKAVKK
jgi:hypothetical protein